MLSATLAIILALSAQPSAGAREAERLYQVQPGDTLGHIALATGVSVDRLAALNRLADPDRLRAGQVLQVSQLPGDPAGTRGTGMPDAPYVVKAGDSLWRIAQATGVPLAALVEANQLADPHRLTVGQSLRLPVPAPVAADIPLRVVVDAGHGGREVGASHTFADGAVQREDELNLRVALRLRELLQRAGYHVTLTRATAAAVNTDQRDLNGDGKVSIADELQARVDLANQARADLLVSVHFNGHSDPSVRGTYTFWNPDRPFASQSKALAERVQAGLVRALERAGYRTLDHGARTDASVLGDGAYFLLGPRSGLVARPSQMPAIIGEALFLTNPRDAAASRSEQVMEAVARGYFEGIHAYAATLRARTDLPAPDASPAARPARADQVERFWTVWAVTYHETPTGTRRSEQASAALAGQGLPAEVLASRRYEALQPGFLVVSSGRFPSRQAATAHLPSVRAAGYPDAYVREVGP